jgi:hypothetical protein
MTPAVSPCATTIGVPPSAVQLPCAAALERAGAEATGAGAGVTIGAGEALAPLGGARGCDSIFVFAADLCRGEIVPVVVRSTGADAELPNGLEKGSDSRVASEQPVRRAATAVAIRRRHPTRAPA